ncbi:MAG: UDP-3-O-(3-hydroxymyristoyl)glucosamine N-acyltransferase [Pseudomonadota bacterium]
MAHLLKEIAQALGLDALGDGALVIEGLAEPADAGPRDLALASTPAYAAHLTEGRAKAAVLWGGADWRALGLEGAICVGRPRYALAALSRLHDRAWRSAPHGAGVHPSAHIDPSAEINGATIGPFTSIGPDVRLGEGACIGSHVSLGRGALIGPGATIGDGVRIAHNVRAGEGLIVQPGAIIGGDGFSFVTQQPSAAEAVRASLGESDGGDGAQAQSWARIHSLGGVEIGAHVEIGAGTSIDAGTIRPTRVGDGTKIDSLVQVGHNVTIGAHTLLCGQVGIGGSARIGSHVILGGKTGVVDNISVGDRVITGAGTLLMANVPEGRAMLGYPATQMKAHIESYKALRRLPRDIKALKKAVSKPEPND